jgi:1-acyl-sn-glycerol-3-phosphate acyltransferase
MPVHHQVARFGAFVARTYYRLQVEGARPPAAGPLLVVANHPNSLLDPALVTLAVGRPARFLAKAPLFTDRNVGWLVRASGAIPVHRRQDGDGAAGANDDTFRAAEAALAAGDAIALFPEGISHDSPGLAPLKTGAARLALQTAARLGGAFPLVPVGITLDDRAIFRSAGLLVVGAPVAWDDLARAEIAAGSRRARARLRTRAS